MRRHIPILDTCAFIVGEVTLAYAVAIIVHTARCKWCRLNYTRALDLTPDELRELIP